MASDTASKEKLGREQNVVTINIILALIVLFCFGLTAIYCPFPNPSLPTMADRAVFTVRWLLVSSLTVFAGVSWVATVRFFTPAINPLDKSASAQQSVDVASRYLQNTIEQFLMHSIGLLVLASHVSGDKMYLIPLLVALFVIGRVFFAVGYRMSYLYRGFGFVLTWYPSIAVYAYCLYASFAYGFEPRTLQKGQ